MPEPALTLLAKSDYLIFLDVKQDLTMASCDYARVDKSTVWELSMNEKTEEYDYIDQKDATTEVEGNKPSLSQEIRTIEGNKLHDFIAKHFQSMPVGEQCKTPCLVCFGGSGKVAWRGIATLTNKALNAVDKKYTFNIELGGNIEIGTYSVLEGAPTFNPSEPAMVM